MGQLHYRLLDSEKIKYLKEAKGNFEAIMPVNDEMKKELVWWCSNIYFEIRHIFRGKLEATIKTDASLLGWGAIMKISK